ncbi:MAG: hypothetical protein HY275_10545 [Gemmatimonadetes bacterium]|nr:hypothetical protein [Gemmatimonadota bacterium]
MTLVRHLAAFALVAASSGAAIAQQATDDWYAGQPAQKVQFFRPRDLRGLNIFEAPKDSGVAYKGFDWQIGLGFAQQFQSLAHYNGYSETGAFPAAPNTCAKVGTPAVSPCQLIGIGPGFNIANANLYLDFQLARGIRMQSTLYLSSKHHNETWVKDGYIQVDASPWKNETLDKIFERVTVKIGHMEINYGDTHFRRSDNGMGLFNPFVGNLLMDAFSTQVGAEFYYTDPIGAFGMFGITSGELNSTVANPNSRDYAFLYKAGFDKQLNSDWRFRIAGSLFTQASAINNTLYGGDRAGSRYGYVLENTAATLTANAFSGNFDPSFKDRIQAMEWNLFLKWRDAEMFGVYENSRGRTSGETVDRVAEQVDLDLIYRFLPSNRAFVAARYNKVDGTLPGPAAVTAIRRQVGAGMFITPSMAVKIEYVHSGYYNYPTNNIRYGGIFKGLMLEADVAF